MEPSYVYYCNIYIRGYRSAGRSGSSSAHLVKALSRIGKYRGHKKTSKKRKLIAIRAVRDRLIIAPNNSRSGIERGMRAGV